MKHLWLHAFITGLLFMFWAPATATAQEMLLEKEVEDIREDTPKFGPNRKHYVHLYAEGNFAVSPMDGEGAEIKYFRSGGFLMGMRYKYRIKGLVQTGIALELGKADYHIKQNDDKTFPNQLQHKEEILQFNNATAELYLRVNLAKRGNQIGTFIDLAGYWAWLTKSSHYIRDDADDETLYNAATKEVYYTDLKYMEDYVYGARFRLGHNNWVFSLGYRLSDYFKDDLYEGPDNQGVPEMPRFTAGIQIGIHR